MTATMTEAPPMPALDLAYPRTVTELRKTISPRLVLATVDGQRWASNGFYITPASRFDRLELAELRDGCYLPDGKAWAPIADADPVAALERFVTADDTYTEPVTLTELSPGRPAIVAIAPGERQGDETLAVPFGDGVSLNARYLRLVADTAELSKPYGDVLGDVTLRQQDSVGRPVGVFVNVEHRRLGHRDTTTEAYRWVPETLEPAGERLIGVLMPLRLA